MFTKHLLACLCAYQISNTLAKTLRMLGVTKYRRIIKKTIEFQAERYKMKEHLSSNMESHLSALSDLVNVQKKQLDIQRERIQLQKEHIQLQKETLLLQKQEIIDVRGRTANGEFIWRIPDFNRKLMDAKSGRAPEPMISEPFYTHPHGYKMCAGLWLNGVGTGRGRYISVGLQVSKYDGISLRVLLLSLSMFL